ncbi:hypothetical protein BTHI11S_06331 [Bosea thiooxidans]
MPPALPAKTPTEPPQPILALPVLVVQLVPNEVQVPAPPLTPPEAVVFAPSQNCMVWPTPNTARLTWPATPVSTPALATVRPALVDVALWLAKLPASVPP